MNNFHDEVAVMSGKEILSKTPGQRQPWTPGQRLHSAAEVMQALLGGEKLGDNYSPRIYVHLVDGDILWNDGQRSNITFSDLIEGFHIYTPPKHRMRRITSERWFAILEVKHPSITPVIWSTGYEDKEGIKHAYPNALAYHCATVEIEIDDSISGG